MSVAGPKFFGPALDTHPLATAHCTCGRAQNDAAKPAVAGACAVPSPVGAMTGMPCQNVPGAGVGVCAAAARPPATTMQTIASTARTTTREAQTPSTANPRRPILHDRLADVTPAATRIL